MEKNSNQQKNLAKLIKIMKVKDNDFSYKDLAEMIDINTKSFYCWLNGQFNLSYEKFRYLEDWYYCRSEED